jgi:hypothetical protein
VATDQTYEGDEWHGLTEDRVLKEELTARQCTLAGKGSLDMYAKALVPAVGSMATYLLHSRNREGAWIRCRLRSNTLPLMQVLYRQCVPQRPTEESLCPLCSSAEGETTEHFLSSCQSQRQRQLRQELCTRLEAALQQWHGEQTAALMDDWKALPVAAATSAVTIRQAGSDALNGYDAITATLCGMRSGDSGDVSLCSQWCELLLGRCTDPESGASWDASLVEATMRPIHNFLLVAWRARAEALGGVPYLTSGGRAISIAPYRRMKSIGGIQSQQRGDRSSLPACTLSQSQSFASGC